MSQVRRTLSDTPNPTTLQQEKLEMCQQTVLNDEEGISKKGKFRSLFLSSNVYKTIRQSVMLLQK